MAISFARELDDELNPKILRLGAAFSGAAQSLKSPYKTDYADSTAETGSEFETLALDPGAESLKQRIVNLIREGEIHKAVEMLQNTLEKATEIEKDQLAELAYDTLDMLVNEYPHETNLLNNLANTLADYDPVMPSLITTQDFGGPVADYFGPGASEEPPQSSPNVGTVGKYMAGQTTQANMSVLRRDDPWKAWELTLRPAA